jgi:hypothetical protein
MKMEDSRDLIGEQEHHFTGEWRKDLDFLLARFEELEILYYAFGRTHPNDWDDMASILDSLMDAHKRLAAIP